MQVQHLLLELITKFYACCPCIWLGIGVHECCCGSESQVGCCALPVSVFVAACVACSALAGPQQVKLQREVSGSGGAL